MKELKIRGLNITLSEFFDVFEKSGCLFIPYGEAVKDLLLGSIKDTSPLKIEGASSCHINEACIVCFYFIFSHFILTLALIITKSVFAIESITTY